MAAEEDAIADLEHKLRSLESLRSELGDALFNRKRAGLEARLRDLREARSVQTPRRSRRRAAPGPHVAGDVDTGGGHFVGGNQYKFEYRDQPPRELLLAYYRCLAQDCARLPLGVVDPRFVSAGSKKEELSLASIYTDLDVVALPREQNEAAERWGLRLARGEGGERTPLLSAIADDRFARLALIGDPGSGKTTFVNYLTFLLARAAAPALPGALKGLIPVRLVLRNAVRHIPGEAEKGSGAMLWEALRADIEGYLGRAATERLFPHLQDRLLKQPGLFLLDGLDEVPEAEHRRRSLLEAIAALAGSLPVGSRLLLTARPYAYADPKWHLPGFELLALSPFSAEQVRRFVGRWYAAVQPVMGWDAAAAQDRARKLEQVLLVERPELADLASRPLLLTLIATLHTSWGQLPDDRADLYEESVKLLLSRWQRGREVRGEDGKPVQEPGIARALSWTSRSSAAPWSWAWRHGACRCRVRPSGRKRPGGPRAGAGPGATSGPRTVPTPRRPVFRRRARWACFPRARAHMACWIWRVTSGSGPRAGGGAGTLCRTIATPTMRRTGVKT